VNDTDELKQCLTDVWGGLRQSINYWWLSWQL